MTAADTRDREQLGPALLSILAAVKTTLEDAGRPVGLAHLAPGGSVAFDNCCDDSGGPGGQLWVRVISMFPSGRPFPGTDVLQPCDGVTLLGVQVGIGIVRCCHTLDDDGDPPTADQMIADTLATTADANLVLHAIECLIPEIRQIQVARVGTWSPLGPQGGCAGGEWTIMIGIDNCVVC